MIESDGEWSDPDYLDTADSGKKKETKAYIFYRIESEEVCERYITPCFVEGLDDFDGVTDLEYEKNLLLNEFVVKLGFTYVVIKNGDKVVDQKLLVSLKGELYFIDFIVNPKEDDVEPCVIFGQYFLKHAKAIIDFRNGILTIWPKSITFDLDDDELDALLASINIDELPPIDITNFPPFVCKMGKGLRNKKNPTKTYYKMTYDGEGPLLTVIRPKTQVELTKEELEEDLYEIIMWLNEKRPIIETLKYGDKHKMFLDSVLLDKLKLDGEFELEEEIVGEQVIREYKAIKEKEDLGCFVLHIRLEGKYDFHALVDMGSNINMTPYRIYELLDKEKVKPRIDKVTMLDHSNAETMGSLLNVLCQVGVTTVLTNFMLLDVPVNRDVPIIVGRSFIVAKVRNVHEESDSDDKEDYSIKRDDFGRPFYGPHRPPYLDYEDVMDRALAQQDYLYPFRKVCVWKKLVSFLGTLPVSLKNTDWKPNYSRRNIKEEGYRKWHIDVKVVDPFGNAFERRTKFTKEWMIRSATNARTFILHFYNAGTHDYEAESSSSPKRHRETKTVEEAMLGRVYHPKLLWAGCTRDNKRKYNTILARWLSKQFNEEVTGEELSMKKIIRFRLEVRAHFMSLLEFACLLGLYKRDEILEEGFEVYFQGGLCNDDYFDANEYWIRISTEDQLRLSRSATHTIRS
ncbi:reverse transcriptase domain-containing protein [Tanacetum coccineum]